MKLKPSIIICFIILTLLSSSCEEEDPSATIIIVGSNPTLPTQTAPASTNPTFVPPVETLTPVPVSLNVTAGPLTFSSCNCKGVPLNVKVELLAEGGVPPYTLEGFNKAFNNSYQVPIGQNIDSLDITVSSRDGQKVTLTIDIPPCTPPAYCQSDGDSPSTGHNPTGPNPTDPDPTEPDEPPPQCPTKPGRPGRPDCK